MGQVRDRNGDRKKAKARMNKREKKVIYVLVDISQRPTDAWNSV